jgi:hypothetical protein
VVRLPAGLAEPRVGVAGVGARCLGQDADEGQQQECDEEFHDGILRPVLDKSNRMWLAK